MFEDFKSQSDMKKFSEDWSKKALMAWVAVETVMKSPQPAFAAALQ